ncbi:GatB/Yqey domain-containing protein [Zopfochytrium polystomum]|nr:GatB/Yqey domain-containing protein [Zopfochytrium polystomum]
MHPTCIIKPPTNTTAAPSSTSTSSSDDGAADVTSRLKAELKASMKAAKKARVTVIKSLLSDLTYASKQAPPVEPELVIQRALKRRMDSIESYTQSGHLDLVQSEQAEVAIIQEFLPKQLGQDELEAIVRSVAQKLAAKSPKDMGPVMKQVILELPSGSATRKDISDTVKRVLSSL